MIRMTLGRALCIPVLVVGGVAAISICARTIAMNRSVTAAVALDGSIQQVYGRARSYVSLSDRRAQMAAIEPAWLQPDEHGVFTR